MENEKPRLASLEKALQVRPYAHLIAARDARDYGRLTADHKYLIHEVYHVLDVRPGSLKPWKSDVFVKLVDVEFKVISDKGYVRVSCRAFRGFQ